jgi:hypothetical protein
MAISKSDVMRAIYHLNSLNRGEIMALEDDHDAQANLKAAIDTSVANWEGKVADLARNLEVIKRHQAIFLEMLLHSPEALRSYLEDFEE